MRILNLKKYMIDALNMLEIKESKHSTTYYTFVNWMEVCNTLRQLHDVKFLEKEVQAIFDLGIHFESPTKSLKIDTAQYSSFMSRYSNVRLILSKSIELIDEFYEDDSPDQINVKLPEGLTLSGLTNIIQDIDFIFNKCRVISELNNKNEVKINKVDSGSIWLILGIASAAIPLIGQLVTLAFDISKKINENKIILQQVRVLKCGADMIETMENELEEHVRSFSREKAEELSQRNNLSDGYEDLNSLAKSMEKMANLICGGVTIYASLAAPKETIESFPVKEEKPSIATEIKKLMAPKDE